MLAPQHRLTSAEDFRRTIRSGSKTVTPTVVIHCALSNSPNPSRFGITVSKAVGGSVIRHRVARQIRHAITDVLRSERRSVPPGSRWVVRALPQAASGGAARDVHVGMTRLLGKVR